MNCARLFSLWLPAERGCLTLAQAASHEREVDSRALEKGEPRGCPTSSPVVLNFPACFTPFPSWRSSRLPTVRAGGFSHTPSSSPVSYSLDMPLSSLTSGRFRYCPSPRHTHCGQILLPTCCWALLRAGQR
ncbi:zinc finger CW-type PWWP domain protein 1 [Platysternon megacephalum]|uniref:Zinc finger CW-type PWWP domain protein 1 n=1 Tax=Platysternon megacephalum TaxID=55544 RepID=A0A4D9DSM9_9SAUR|nr:zinc finger CW-type PWWP domain protein 1 [Platysternon megacephalum]